jgi:hypothetical protein
VTLQIQKLINRVRIGDARGERNLILSITEAKDIVAEITLLLLQLESFRSAQQSDEVTMQDVRVSGGSFVDD